MTAIPAATTADEAARLMALDSLNIMDSLAESAFDDIVMLASEICKAPISLVSLVDGERQWFKARVGLAAQETHRDLAFCAHAILDPRQLMIVEDAALDPRFRDNALVTGAPHIRFYAGAPIITGEGQPLGTVCVIDTVPRTLNPEQQRALAALARQTSALLQLRQLSRAKTDYANALKEKVTAALSDNQRVHAGLRQSQRVASVGQLTSGIAHDFNNLLQTVHVSLQLIERKADQPDHVRRWAQSGLRAVGQGARLSSQLLAFSRDQSNEDQPLPVDQRLAEMCELLTRALGPQINFTVELTASDCLITGDMAQFEAAVLNLAINARDALGGVGRITLSTRRIAFPVGDANGFAPGDYVRLTVSDDGPGMPPEIAARAFEPFFTTKPDGKGTGLGLAQVYGFATRAGGDARIDTVSERGTAVTLWLPCTHTAGAAEDKSPTQASSEGAHERVSVLLVDDDPLVRTGISALLEDAGYQVHSADGGRSALALIEAAMAGKASGAAHLPDLILTDCAMQDISGMGLAEKLAGSVPDIPVVFMTGHSDPDLLLAALGPDAVIVRKPASLATLGAALTLAMARKTKH